MVATFTAIMVFLSCMTADFVPYTMFFRTHHRKKSKGVKLGGYRGAIAKVNEIRKTETKFTLII